jgi:hypothetical protein
MLELATRVPYGINCTSATGGVFSASYPAAPGDAVPEMPNTSHLIRTGMEKGRAVAFFSDTIRVPMAPFMGTMGELHQVLKFVFRKQLKPVIDRVYPLAEIRAGRTKQRWRQWARTESKLCLIAYFVAEKKACAAGGTLPRTLMAVPTLEGIFSQLAVEQDTASISREIADLIRA